MIKHAKSHLDHGLTEAQVAYIMERFAGRDSFFIETFDLPEHLGAAVPCGLYGPLVGDEPVPEAIPACGVCSPCGFYNSGALCHVRRDGAFMMQRGDREYKSRVVHKPSRPTRKVTVIAGPHEEHACILYTAFGGPLTPREPGDIRAEMAKLEEERRDYHRAFQVGAATEEMKRAEMTAHDKIIALRPKRDESDKFWSEHALAL